MYRETTGSVSSNQLPMISEVWIYNNPRLGEIRAAWVDREPFFVGADVMSILYVKGPLTSHVDAGRLKNAGRSTPGGQEILTLINIAGLFELINHSRTPRGNAFCEWIIKEVLPSVYKYKCIDDRNENVLLITRNEWETQECCMMELMEENAEQKRLLEEYQPKVNYCDRVLQTEDAIPITQIAKEYGYTGCYMNKLLHEMGIQYKQGNTWLLYRKYDGRGYTLSRTEFINGKYSYIHMYWTQKGRRFIYEQLREIGILPINERTKD